MSTTSSFRHVNEALRLFGYSPEVTQGNRCMVFEASGGTTSSVTVNTSSSVADNANAAAAPLDVFAGLSVIFTGGALQGTIAEVANSSTSGSTLTLNLSTTLTAAPSAGDSFLLLGVLPAADPKIEPETEILERDFARLSLDPAPGIAGITKVTGSFDVDLFGLRTPLSPSATPAYDVISQLLAQTFARSAHPGTTTAAGSTPSVVVCADVSSFSVGELVLISGEVRLISSIDSTAKTLTLQRALSAAPAAGVSVYSGEHLEPVDADPRSVSFMLQIDDQVEFATGCLYSASFKADFGTEPRLSVSFTGSGYSISDGASYVGLQQGGLHPFAFVSGEVTFGTTELYASSVSFDLAHGLQEIRDTEAGSVVTLRSRAATAQVSLRDIDAVPRSSWDSTKQQNLLLCQLGNSAGKCVAVYGNAQVTKAAAGSQNATKQWSVDFAFKDDHTDSAQRPKIVRF